MVYKSFNFSKFSDLNKGSVWALYFEFVIVRISLFCKIVSRLVAWDRVAVGGGLYHANIPYSKWGATKVLYIDVRASLVSIRLTCFSVKFNYVSLLLILCMCTR